MAQLWIFVAFLFGAAAGSFLNVCIYRIPENRSVIRPRSSCPHCGKPIRFLDNIPILSWIFLKGSCRECGEPVSARYLIIEVLAGLLSTVLFMHFDFSLHFLAVFAFCCALVVITFIDLDHQIIPDAITLPGIPICFLLSVLVLKLNWLDALLGIVIGGGSLYLIAFGYRFFAHREGMGMGDVKLLAMLGAFLGWKSLIFILLVSSFLGSLVGLSIVWAKRANMKYAIPYGPFLSLAGIAYVFWGPSVMNFILLR